MSEFTREQTLQATYEGALSERLIALVASGTDTLFELGRATGAFPTLILELASRHGLLVTQHRPPHWVADGDDLPGFPEPHPLDYEWRYSRETSEFLCQLLRDHRSASGFVACFGTPSVYSRLIATNTPAVLFDRNPACLSLRSQGGSPATDWFHSADLLTEAESELERAADVALLDPPWYVDHTVLWLKHALRSVRDGGTIVLTLFPELLRPRAHAERLELTRLLEQIGPVETLQRRAFYSTPMFEREALAAAGIAGLGAWRSGDLISVRVERRPELPSPVVTEPKWQRFRLGTQVVALRTADDCSEDQLSLTAPNDDGSFLVKSVSSRDPVRERLTLWTSRNRGAVLTPPGRAQPFLQTISQGISPAHALSEAREIDRLALATTLALIGW